MSNPAQYEDSFGLLSQSNLTLDSSTQYEATNLCGDTASRGMYSVQNIHRVSMDRLNSSELVAQSPR